jgi:Zn-dependent metalloprotease
LLHGGARFQEEGSKMRAKLGFTLLTFVGACEGAITDDRFSTNSEVQEALSALPHAEVLDVDGRGFPRFVRGQLGTLELLAPVFDLDVSSLRLEGSVDDDRGTHLRYRQTIGGLDVIGGELAVHVDLDGLVYAVHGGARGGGDADPTPAMGADDARAAALAIGPAGAIAGEPRLVFVVPDEGGDRRLAWEVRVTGQVDDLPVDDRVYVAADDLAIVDVRPQVHTARNRRVYTAANGTSLPGTLRRSEGQAAVSDAVSNAAYDNTGKTYDCYAARFGRDSFDAAGATLHSTVHYASGYNNAFWDGSRMVYGDGDGVEFSPLAGALDVTAHELTHAVTQVTAGLPYRNEPGAINEAMSDIVGATCEAWSRGGAVSAATWLIGEEVTTPGTAGDALRYMHDPTADGYSYDYYPERYIGSWDYGGVHVNSGIANLAFKLLVTGGSHPRGKTTVEVPAIGLEQASAIFYRALTVYMTSSTNFAGARAATVQAALDLGGDATAQTVHKAWNAVGAPGAPTDPGGGGGGGAGVLENGRSVDGLSGAAGSEVGYRIDVPAGTTSLTIRMAGGTGDADLYVRQGAAPTRTTYDYRPYLSGNAETVTISAPASGSWHVMIRGYSAYSGVSIVASMP